MVDGDIPGIESKQPATDQTKMFCLFPKLRRIEATCLSTSECSKCQADRGLQANEDCNATLEADPRTKGPLETTALSQAVPQNLF